MMFTKNETKVTFWLFVLVFLRSDKLTLAQGEENELNNSLVVDGIPAEPKEFPHIARLGNRNEDNVTNWFCGGTLISNRLVLTAAHCLYSESGEINVVRLGELDFASDAEDSQPEDFDVIHMVEHPNYKYPLMYNDIALLQLSRLVNLNEYKLPACLPSTDSIANEQLFAIGWGHMTQAGEESKRLLKVQLQDFGNRCLDATDIDELPNGFNVSSQLCMGSTTKDTCNGESGGPVLIDDHVESTCRFSVVGITSLGIGCGTPNEVSIYTRVHYYVDWIRSVKDKQRKDDLDEKKKPSRPHRPNRPHRPGWRPGWRPPWRNKQASLSSVCQRFYIVAAVGFCIYQLC